MEILGPPSMIHVMAMNSNYDGSKCLEAGPRRFWGNVFKANTSLECINFVARLLKYDPKSRPTPLDCLLDSFFDELRIEGKKLPNGLALPDGLFDFTELEHETYYNHMDKLIPTWYNGPQFGKSAWGDSNYSIT